MSDADVEVLEHEVGIRPTVIDRRPLLGKHPEFDNILIFNGLGTKGVMLAPYFAQHLVDFIEGNILELEGEVNINRFNKYFKNV